MNQAQRWYYYYAGGTSGGGGTGIGLSGNRDLTTDFLAWLAARSFSGDVNTAMRDYLAGSYSSGDNEDASTLFAKLDDHNREP